jgi:glucosyl-3-phosphoglycerate synthase
VVDGVAAWFDASTSSADDWSIDTLLRLKANDRVSVVIPARDEAPTVGSIVRAIRTELVEAVGLVDELVVVDSDSTDETARIAAEAGARVVSARSIRPDLGGYAGKGEALWKAQFVTTGDVLVFIDADLTGWGTHFVTGLLGPLFSDSAVQLVKGFYDRMLEDGSGRHAAEGGRVTELVARPLLSLRRPELSRVVQPLAGEWAIRRKTFAALHVPVGYGVEMATLLDVHKRFGLAGIAQVDLGERAHVHQSVHDLGVMAAQILAVTLRRTEPAPGPDEDRLWQFQRHGGNPWLPRPVPLEERPPANSVRVP